MNASPLAHHRKLNSSNTFLFLGGIVLLAIACNLASPAGEPPTQTPFVITATLPPAVDTATLPAIPSTDAPVPSATASLVPATATKEPPACIVLQDVNLRSGPGTAYNPPVTFLAKDTTFTPIGFNPAGVPGGSWVQARVAAINQIGWISGGIQYVSCNIDLATLPQVAVAPPPKAAPPTLGAGAVDGSNIDSFRFSVDYNPDYMVRMFVFRSDDPDEGFTPNKDGRGIDSVVFQVTTPNGNRTFYESTESNAGYCIFGGGEPDCSPWIYENGQYKWRAGGDPVEDRNYKLVITVNADDGQVGVWLIDITLTLH
jgi:hypothetical protein